MSRETSSTQRRAELTAYMDESVSDGQATIWSVALIVPTGSVRTIARAIDDVVRDAGGDTAAEIKGAGFFAGSGGLGIPAGDRANLVAALHRTLRDADAKIVARGIQWREAERWLNRSGSARTPYDVTFGHALHAIGRVAGSRGVNVVHDETSLRRSLDATFRKARERGVYHHRREPLPMLGELDFEDSASSRAIQMADLHAWAFQRVWAKTPGRRRGAQSVPNDDRVSEAARLLVRDAKDLIAHRRVWRPALRRR